MSTRRNWVLIGIVAVGLVVDAAVHLSLANSFPDHRTSVLSEAAVFRIEAVVALVAAVGVVVRRRWWTAAFAVLVSVSAVAAVVVYRYVDLGAIGPIPDMYDPYWGPAAKVVSLVAEAAAAVASIGLLTTSVHRAPRAHRATPKLV